MNWKLFDNVLSLFIPGVILIHLLLAPYAKVEESFNLQATHDVLAYGTPTHNIGSKLRAHYDHFTFPGVVPRTFIGPVLLAGVGQPFVMLLGPQWAQFVIRLVLGMFNAGCLLWFGKNVAGAFGKPTARWYTVLQATQFHIMFYASRTLPNMFAFGLTTLAFANLLPVPNKPTAPRHRLALSFFVFAAVIFRSEIALLLATTFLSRLMTGQTTIPQLILPFIVSFTAALAISVPIDSYFWQRFVWPELAGFWYNAVEGKSSNWGTSPAWWYFTNALPKLLMVSMPLLSVSLARSATRRSAVMLVAPCLAFVGIYSMQPHKEARFIFYVVPPLTAVAALGANSIWKNALGPLLSANKKTDDKMDHANPIEPTVDLLLASTLLLAVLASFFVSTIMLGLSSLNYPGGEALTELSHLISETNHSSAVLVDGASSPVARVHADVLSCMTGISLFGISAASASAGVDISLDRTEDPRKLSNPQFWDKFAWALAEDPQPILNSGSEWQIVAVVEGFVGLKKDFVRTPLPGPEEAGLSSDEARSEPYPVVGCGLLISKVENFVKGLTGGRWVGPRMEPKINILHRGKLGEVKITDISRDMPS